MVYFIIIYGSYGITYSKGKGGSFHCPSCAAAQAYRHRRVRRFFHIFFLPLIPLTLAGEYVECGQCKGTFKLEVLDPVAAAAKAARERGPSAAQVAASESQRGVRRVLAMMMLADGVVEESEIQAIVQHLSRTEKRVVTRDEVVAELEAARRDKTDLETYCRSLMGYLNIQGRRDVLEAANMVANADGHVDPSEKKMLEKLGIALGLKPSEVSTALANQVHRLYAPAATAQPTPMAQPAQTAPRAPFCPRCGAPGRWIADHHTWGCDHCRAAIPAPM